MTHDALDGLDPTQAASAALRHREFVKGLAWHLVRDPAEQEDLEQEAWLAMIERPPRSRHAVRSWLSSTLRRVRGKRTRTEVRRRAREEATASREPVPSTEDLVLRIELEQRVVKAVTGLAEPYRTAILLRFYEDLSSREIAERLGISDTAVRARLWRGVQRLREDLDDAHGGRSEWRPALIAACGLDLGAPPPVPTDPTGTVAASSTHVTEGVLFMNTPVLGAAALALCAATVLYVAADDPAPKAASGRVVAHSDPAAPSPAASSSILPATMPAATRVASEATSPTGSVDPTPVAAGAGHLRLRPVDATTGEPVPAFVLRTLSDDRYAQVTAIDEDGLYLTASTWDLAIRARGYEPYVLRGVEVPADDIVDLGYVALTPGRAAVEVGLDVSGAPCPSPVLVELHGSVPLGGAATTLQELPVVGFFLEDVTEATQDEEPIAAGVAVGQSFYVERADTSELGVTRRSVVPGDAPVRFEGLPAGDYVLTATAPEAGLFVRREFSLRAGGRESITLHSRPVHDLELVLIAPDGRALDVDQAEPGEVPFHAVDVQVRVAGRPIGSAWFESEAEVLYDEVYEESASFSRDGSMTPEVIDRERQEGDELLPPFSVGDAWHDFTGAREGGNVYPIAGLPGIDLELKIGTEEGEKRIPLDLRGGSPGRVVVKIEAGNS